MAPAASVEPYWERFKRLKDERGLSWSQLVRASANVSLSTLRAFAIPPSTNGERGRERYPSATTIADVANALGVPPEEFPEYRLALARRLLDERQIGLEGALEVLALFHEALRLHEQHVFATPRLEDAVQRARAALGPGATADPSPAGVAPAPKGNRRASKRGPE